MYIMKRFLWITVSSLCSFVVVLLLTFLFLGLKDEKESRKVTIFTFESGVIQPVSQLKEKNIQKGDLVIKYKNGQLNITVSNRKLNISAEMSAFPGQNDYYKGNVLLFIADKITEGYSLASCRIETLADSVTLLPENLDYVGHTVLSIGFQNKETKDVYYIQVCIDDFNIDAILIDADENLKKSDYTKDDLYDLELSYITLMN